MEVRKWVKGNTQPIAVALILKTAVNGQWQEEDYIPPTGSELHVALVGKYRSTAYNYTLVGNVVSFVDDGSLKEGVYGVEITVMEPNNVRRRTFRCGIVEVVSSSSELGELINGEVVLDAAVYLQGEKGDPFTYDDFTPEQIEDIKRPATEAAELAETAAGHAEQATGDANDAAAAANEKAGYAKQQGDYAKQKADEIEDAKGSFPNLNARLDSMQTDIDDRMERITEEQFNAIFD